MDFLSFFEGLDRREFRLDTSNFELATALRACNEKFERLAGKQRVEACRGTMAPTGTEMKAPKSVSVSIEPEVGDSSIQEESIDDQCMKYQPADPGFWEKGNISNLVTFVFMVVGIVMRFAMGDWDDNIAGRYILAFGLFGFAGGVTNWLAITMLFDEVPGLYGSGIIPKQFKQIRQTMKVMIILRPEFWITDLAICQTESGFKGAQVNLNGALINWAAWCVCGRDTFFAPAFLEKQLKEKLGTFTDSKVVEEKLQDLLDSPEFEIVLDQKLASLGSSPMGMMLSMMSLNASKIKPFIKVGYFSNPCALPR
eukprot:1176301-Prorocentrum_minimum.AAC.1